MLSVFLLLLQNIGCPADILEDGGFSVYMVQVIQFDQALNLPSFRSSVK
jgi:hypothetical protein